MRLLALIVAHEKIATFVGAPVTQFADPLALLVVERDAEPRKWLALCVKVWKVCTIRYRSLPAGRKVSACCTKRNSTW